MLIGVPKEIKKQEYRVGLTPVGARQLIENGHRVLVEAGAGEGSGYSDQLYRAAGALIAEDPGEVWGTDLVIKVKEPLLFDRPVAQAQSLEYAPLNEVL